MDIPRGCLNKMRKGSHISEETRKKLSGKNNHMFGRCGEKHPMFGKPGPNLGKHFSEETRKKLSESHKGILAGEKHPNWKGGISFEPYSTDWVESLKESIRQRDNHTCRLCGSHQEKRTFHVHHIDYDKKNCDPQNLITLCYSCHTKTNHKREKWIEIFQLILNPFEGG